MTGGGTARHGKVYVRRAPLADAAAVQAAVEGLFASLPAAGRLAPGMRVLIKPNLLRKNAPEAAVTTHPAVLRAVILALQRRGVSHITVADSPGGPYTPAVMRAVYAGCGVAAVCGELGAHLYTACESGKAAANGERVQSFTLLRPVLEADFIINLPKMKTHVLTRVSGAVKNLFGCVPGLQKAEFHMRFPEWTDFASMLVDLCETVRPDMTVVDGLLAMEGDGPAGGRARRCDVLLGGEDAYRVDLALCRLMGVNAAQTPVAAAACRRGLCPPALPDADFVGEEDAKAPVPGFAPPRSYGGRMDFSSHAPKLLRPLVSFAAARLAPRPVIRRGRCIGCGRCAEICPQKTLRIQGGKAEIFHGKCIKCFCCHEMCPVNAVGVARFGLFGRQGNAE